MKTWFQSSDVWNQKTDFFSDKRVSQTSASHTVAPNTKRQVRVAGIQPFLYYEVILFKQWD